MDYRRLMTQTIPTLSAVGLASCAPIRGGGGGGGGGNGGGGVADIVGAWALTSFTYSGEISDYYPSGYTYEGCEVYRNIWLQVTAALTADLTVATVYEDCEYYSEPYGYRYPGIGMGEGTIRFDFDGLGFDIECPEEPGDTMQCASPEGDEYQYGFSFRRTTDSIPEVPVYTGGDDDDDVPVDPEE